MGQHVIIARAAGVAREQDAAATRQEPASGRPDVAAVDAGVAAGTGPAEAVAGAGAIDFGSCRRVSAGNGWPRWFGRSRAGADARRGARARTSPPADGVRCRFADGGRGALGRVAPPAAASAAGDIDLRSSVDRRHCRLSRPARCRRIGRARRRPNPARLMARTCSTRSSNWTTLRWKRCSTSGWNGSDAMAQLSRSLRPPVAAQARAARHRRAAGEARRGRARRPRTDRRRRPGLPRARCAIPGCVLEPARAR